MEKYRFLKGLLCIGLCAAQCFAAQYNIKLAPGDTVTVEAVTVAVPPVVTPVATIPLGINLPGCDDWNMGARAKLFVDVMKTARLINTNRWRVLTTSNNQAQELNWATSGSRQPKIAGTYLLSWTGAATVTCSGGTIKNLTANTADVVITSDAVDVDLQFSAPATNIVMLRPGYPRGTTQTVTNEFKEYTKPFKWIRVMDACGTNIADAADWAERQKTIGADGKITWAERPPDNIQTYNRPYGLSFEAVIRIANECKLNVWYPLPYGFTDDFCFGAAAYSKANLDPALILAFEPLNEGWNYAYGFYQSGLNRADAVAYQAAASKPDLNPEKSAGVNDYYLAQRYLVKRLIDASNIFRATYGADFEKRIRVIFASQFANPSFIADALNWALRSYPNPPNYYLSGIACAPYIGAGTGTPTEIITALQSDIATRQANDSKLMWWRAMADAYQVKLYFYEAGIDMGQGTTNLTNKIAAAYDARMEGVTKSYLESCYFDAGAESLMYFQGVGTRDKWGPAWALTDDVVDPLQPMYLGAKGFTTRPALTDGVKATYFKDTSFTTKLGDLITRVVNHRWQAWSTGGLWGRKELTSTAVTDGSIRFTGRYLGSGTLTAECETNDTATLKVNPDGTFTLDYVARFSGNGTSWVRLMANGKPVRAGMFSVN